MQRELIAATDSAIRAVDAERFFQTERGFQGRFYCALQAELDRLGLLVNGAILEMEYQKSARHGLSQRPDIIFHVPIEHSHTSVTSNNYAVWALKRQATRKDARDDFMKLDAMFESLHYPFGFFVNIDAIDPMRQHYEGRHRTRLAAVAAQLASNQINVVWASADADSQ
jgi:hypothetical protein